MQRRGGGGGGGAGGGGFDANAARQLFMSLFGGALPGGGQHRGSGFSGSRGGRRMPAGARPREGEWACQCGFSTNRAYREACHQCGRSRDVAEVSGDAGTRGGKGFGKRGAADGKSQRDMRTLAPSAGMGKGPMGAGGSRPLLGGRDRGPLGGSAGGGSFKGNAWASGCAGKGPSVSGMGGKPEGKGKTGNGGGCNGAAKGNAGGGGAAACAGEWGSGHAAWVRPATVRDEDGYELVQPRRIRADKGSPKGAEDYEAAKGNGGKGTYAEVVRRRWSDEGDSDDDDMDDQEAGEEEEGCGVEDGGAWEEDPAQLRAEYEEHARAARELERRGSYGPALATLQAARDEAERRWRDAKPPAPLSKRLDWAETKLRKAQAALTRVRLELDAFDEDTDKRRAAICNRVQEAEGWYQWRKQQLDVLHNEAAENAPGRRGEASGSGGADVLRKKIRAHTLPEIQAILEDVPEGTDLHGRLALLAAGLADAEASHEGHIEGEGPATYHMGDGDSQEDWEEEMQGAFEEGGTQGQGPRGRPQGNRPAEWRPEGTGRWTRAGTHRGNVQHPQLDGAAAAAPETRRPNHDDMGKGAGKGGAGGGPTTATTPAAAEGDADDGGATRAGKHRRLQTAAEADEEERAASDTKRAEEFKKQVERATAAQEQSFRDGKGGFGSEAALSAAAQGFVLRVQRVQAQAGEMGIEPRAQDGRTLLELSPAELEQWVHNNLGDDEMRD